MAHGQSCRDLADDLLAIEYKLKSSRLNKCDGDQLFGCRKNSDEESKKTLAEHQIEYNTAMAQLIIKEGLIHLGMSLESDHRALEQLTVADLMKAKNTKKSFDQNLNKANLLESAMRFYGNKNIFDDYDPAESDLESYINFN